MSSIVPIQNACGYCGGFHSGTCPRVKSITYHQNGTVAKVEFHDPNAALRDPQGWPILAPKGDK
jgi:hypothetical protein